MNMRQTGMTLVELMVALTVAIVLMAIGIPAFQNLQISNRTAAQVNTLVTALNLARAEAVGRGLPVSVCAAASDTACGGAGAWATGGWLVFSDAVLPFGQCDGCDQAPDPNLVLTRDQVVRIFAAPGGQPIVTAKDSTNTQLRWVGFNSRGELNGLVTCVDISQVGGAATQQRCLRVAPGGQISTTRGACPSPCQ